MLVRIEEEAHLNQNPESVFYNVGDLRKQMASNNVYGDAFIAYLLEGQYFDGKGIWISGNADTERFYEKILESNPHLVSENPYGEHFNRESVRVRGENPIFVHGLSDAPQSYREDLGVYRSAVTSKKSDPIALYAGGPAAKIASILTLLAAKEPVGRQLAVKYLLDGAEQSNESGSASYEHINHANALNAEHDNTGLGILLLALKRAIFGEKDPNAAIETGYHKVDIWPRGLHWRDVPIYIANEIHGRIQWLKFAFNFRNDHDKSRMASKISTNVLSHIEEVTEHRLRLDNQVQRAIFVYFTKKHHEHSLKDERILTRTIGITPKKLTKSEIVEFYGHGTAANIVSADIFYENSCIRHGFDRLCGDIIEELGGEFRNRTAIRKIFVDQDRPGSKFEVVGVEVEDLHARSTSFQPCSYLGLSLGPTATYHYGHAEALTSRLRDSLSWGLPVPYQTIATGFSAQLLFKITDHNRFRQLPFTGLKQTHFVEVGRSGDFIAIKLTSGGVIGQPVYSRSYAISAIANMLRILTPDTGLEFYDVICAWPCTRGVNGTNNGQVVRLADNAVARFGEGGTGMSKMGTNAQTIMDLVGISAVLPPDSTIPRALYQHTIIDNRRRIRCRLLQKRASSQG